MRLILALVNDDYTDDHVSPALLWMENGKFPEFNNCWECFQPPFFYWIIKTISLPLGLSEFNEVLTVIRVVNFLISTLIMFIIVHVIVQLEINKLLKIALMAFWVLNPELISVGALNSNDPLLILLGCVTYLLIARYYELPSKSLEYILAAMFFLIGITKGNGLVFYFCFTGVGLILLLRNTYKWLDVLRIALVFILSISATFIFGGYLAKYRTTGEPFTTNIPKRSMPDLITVDSTYDGRRGMTSIMDTYTTFRLGSLLEEPFNTNGRDEYPLHRTSLLTQLYGQFSNYFFEFHPRSWQHSNNDMKNFAKINYLLHLPLLLLFLFGIVRGGYNLLKRQISLREIDVLFILLFYAFLIKYSMTYWDFSCMKLIFMFPVLIPLIRTSSVSFNIVKWAKLISYLIFTCVLLYLVNYIYLLRALVNFSQ